MLEYTRIQEQKEGLRKTILALLSKQGEELRLNKSKAIQKQLLTTPEFQRARLVMFFASFGGEVETFDMIRQAQFLGKAVALPVVDPKKKTLIPYTVKDIHTDLVVGQYGIKIPDTTRQNPLNPQAIDLVLVPGLAFDRRNNRLGRGQGYYDRFLKGLPPITVSIGLAFDFQVLDHLPHCPGQDVPVSHVIAA